MPPTGEEVQITAVHNAPRSRRIICAFKRCFNGDFAYLGDELVRIGVPVVLEGKVGRDGRHRYPDVGVLDRVALREVVHDGLRLNMRWHQQQQQRQKQQQKQEQEQG